VCFPSSWWWLLSLTKSLWLTLLFSIFFQISMQRSKKLLVDSKLSCVTRFGRLLWWMSIVYAYVESKYLQLFGSLGCFIMICTSMKKCYLRYWLMKQVFKTGFISWKCWIYRGNSVKISANIFLGNENRIGIVFILYLLSWINRLAGLECYSSCAGHD